MRNNDVAGSIKSPRQRMSLHSTKQGSQCVAMTLATSTRPDLVTHGAAVVAVEVLGLARLGF